MKLNRFERKVLAAIVVAAVMPLVGALVLGRAALREAYEVGINPGVRTQLERGLATYRDHFVALRKHADEVATAISQDYVLHAALNEPNGEGALEPRLQKLLMQYGDVASIRVTGYGAEVSVSDATRIGSSFRPLEIDRDLVDRRGAKVRVTIAAPAQPFIDYQRAGELVDVYRRLEKGKGQVSAFYLLVYMGFLLSVIVIALAVGIVISRRVTQRVALLAAATRRLGAGDLDVQVPTDVNDEIGELTRSWNEMVRDMQQARGRIEFLQRIGAWQEFARRLAHEIKNPLTPIQLSIQEVARGYKGDDEQFKKKLEDTRAIIEEEVATLRRLTAEFSTFAKLPEATLAPADLNDFVHDASRSFEAMREELTPPGRTIELIVETSRLSLPVRIDAMMLKRALDNLVRNALQALRDHPQAAESKLLVRTAREGNEAILDVSDNGPGVPARDRQRVFDPYFTTKSEGTGLGLPIVKKVVLEHHGEITCAESEQHGALFRIRLPLEPLPPAPASAVVSRAESQAIPISYKPKS